MVVFKIKVFYFKIENTPIKDTNGTKKFKRMLSFLFCGQTKAFRYKIVFRGIQPCFLHSELERLACFEPSKAARFLKKLEVNSVLHGQGKYVFKRGLLYNFVDVFFILTPAKKNNKKCAFEIEFLQVLRRFNLRERIHDLVSVTRIACKD